MPEMIDYDGGPYWRVGRKYVSSADMTSTAALTDAPPAGETIVADDLLVSSDTPLEFQVLVESSGHILASLFLPANGTAQITLRDGLRADAAGKKLLGQASVAGKLRVTCCWHTEV